MSCGTANIGEGFSVSFASYCGMSNYKGVALTKTEARDMVARFVRRARKRGQVVLRLRKGYSFELCEPDNCVLVPDYAGIISIEPPPVYKCRECGSEYQGEDSKEMVRKCCSDDD